MWGVRGDGELMGREVAPAASSWKDAGALPLLGGLGMSQAQSKCGLETRDLLETDGGSGLSFLPASPGETHVTVPGASRGEMPLVPQPDGVYLSCPPLPAPSRTFTAARPSLTVDAAPLASGPGILPSSHPRPRLPTHLSSLS